MTERDTDRNGALVAPSAPMRARRQRSRECPGAPATPDRSTSSSSCAIASVVDMTSATSRSGPIAGRPDSCCPVRSLEHLLQTLGTSVRLIAI